MEGEPSGSGGTHFFVTRKCLYLLLRNSGCTQMTDKRIFLRNYIQEKTKCPEIQLPELNHSLSYFMSQFHSRWLKARRIHAKFLSLNKEWLETSIGFTSYTGEAERLKRGRPQLCFEESSERSTREKTKKLRSEASAAELAYATQMSLRASGSIDAAVLVKEAALATSQQAQEYRTALKKKSIPVKSPLSGEEALALIIDAKLSRHQYNLIREKDKQVFPSYKVIQEVKRSCYPPKEAITVNETCAEVKLQAILNHTAKRLVNLQEHVFSTCKDKNNFYLFSKWGFDGSSGFSSYKQKFERATDSDESIFLTSFVPLQLLNDPDPKKGVVLWKNKRPSSTRFCRPIRLQFKRETTELSTKEKEYIDNQIKSLAATNLFINTRPVHVHHILIFSMIDGKICNALTDTKSTLKCYICGATSKDFNKIDTVMLRPVIEENFSFGLSILHAWIRFFECILHLSYKLPTKKWQARDDASKNLIAENKKRIQAQFREEMGLLIDKPKPGFGSTNDGNTARRFFENASKSAQITGINEKLIKDFHIILIVLSSGYDINIEKFRKFCLDVATYFVENYPWYNMSPTIHKILIHGPDVIQSCLLPIGQLSEEAQESRNKDLKLFRRDFARRFQRVQTMEDIFHRLLVSSDPIISDLGKPQQQKVKNIPPEALDLLLPPTVSVQEDEQSSNDSESDEN